MLVMPILKDFKFHSPQSLSAAAGLLGRSKAPMLLAGGTFSLNYLKKTAQYPTDVISLKKISALKGIKTQGKGVWIGAMTTMDELIVSKIVSGSFPSLFEAASRMGTTPIRNMATIGGNIASRFYWVDLPAVLISLGARVSLASKAKKTTIALEEFLASKPDKKAIVTGILLPQKERSAFYFRHTRTAQEVDAPCLGLAFSALRKGSRLADARVVVNTSVSLPVVFRSMAAVLERTDIGALTLLVIEEALLKDAAGTKLDEYRLRLLAADLEKLLNILKGQGS